MSLSTQLLVTAAILSMAAILSSDAQAQRCVRRSRRPGMKTVLDENIELVFGTGEGAGADDADDDCACVPYYQCNDGAVNKNGAGLIDIRLSAGRPCEDVLEALCCGLDRRPDATLPPPPAAPLGCGRRNAAGVGMRITGNAAGEAQFAEFPWMVALLDVGGGVERCTGGGSLIHPAVVLTAGHVVARFVSKPEALHVRVGEWDTQTTSEPLPHQQLVVKEVVMHGKYYRGAMHNDIALLVLRDPVELAGNAAPICLPEQDELDEAATCVATGWGKDMFGAAGCYQVLLKSLALPRVPREQCERQLRATRLGPRFRLHHSALCAGGEDGVDACAGDGGGPLACPWTEPDGQLVYRQTGIISWGIGCGMADVPGVYTNVARFRHWVDEQFALRGLDSASYRRP